MRQNAISAPPHPASATAVASATLIGIKYDVDVSSGRVDSRRSLSFFLVLFSFFVKAVKAVGKIMG